MLRIAKSLKLLFKIRTAIYILRSGRPTASASHFQALEASRLRGRPPERCGRAQDTLIETLADAAPTVCVRVHARVLFVNGTINR